MDSPNLRGDVNKTVGLRVEKRDPINWSACKAQIDSAEYLDAQIRFRVFNLLQDLRGWENLRENSTPVASAVSAWAPPPILWKILNLIDDHPILVWVSELGRLQSPQCTCVLVPVSSSKAVQSVQESRNKRSQPTLCSMCGTQMEWDEIGWQEEELQISASGQRLLGSWF